MNWQKREWGRCPLHPQSVFNGIAPSYLTVVRAVLIVLRHLAHYLAHLLQIQYIC